jgi:hypothetical protein
MSLEEKREKEEIPRIPAAQPAITEVMMRLKIRFKEQNAQRIE